MSAPLHSIRFHKTSLDELEALERRFRQIPFEAILKQDILRLGIDFDQGSLSQGDYKQKDYFIFTFDYVPLDSQSGDVRFKAPEEIRIQGGHFDLRPTIVSVRINPESPYKVKRSADRIELFLNDTSLGAVDFPPIPAYYQNKTKSGKAVGEIAPVIEWGYLIYLTVFRNCQYFGKTEECAFCDINHNYR
ncbi:MAG: radical SAM protein, partial [Leptospiraceae bacterium]|nr:radical SAM protein [Leptospiraceae bacterium]